MKEDFLKKIREMERKGYVYDRNEREFIYVGVK
jgi:hypothetical protein